MKRAGGDVIGVDRRVDIGEVVIGDDVGIEETLILVILIGSVDLIKKEVEDFSRSRWRLIRSRLQSRTRILRNTPVENAGVLIEAVHEYSARRKCGGQTTVACRWAGARVRGTRFCLNP